ncbi:MAG: glucose-1-phosphate adenylyltransferase [Bacillota bacterium]|nr:glucose-1-phosphate adenylyltransferase [Bacillota bacterium]MDP4170628.1 glucose-1-phosphate adenylyltransferase [Bacillota bacterium]
MARKKWIAMVLAGGKGNRLKTLTQTIAKPAVPFGGKYRIIDFALSNCRNSHIDTVGVLTQYQPHVLHTYIGNGQKWQLNQHDGGVTLLPPFETRNRVQWYEGTAAAIYQNVHFIQHYDPEHILIISADHIYKMDYEKMLKHHILTDADVTIGVVKVPWEEASRFGIMNVNKNGKITEFEEKPTRPLSNLASMGVYIFKKEVLLNYLEGSNDNVLPRNDFGTDIIPAMIKDSMVLQAYHFEGYWKDVGTVESFWRANMDLLSEKTNVFMEYPDWMIYTASTQHPPLFLDSKGAIMKSLVSEGCRIYGIIKNSVLCTGVKVGKNTVIRNSVILPGAEIGNNALIQNAVIGCNVTIKDRMIVKSSDQLNEIILVGQNEEFKMEPAISTY